MSDPRPLVATELARLADALAGLGDAAWHHDSLCAGWQVRHVVGHPTMAARYDAERFGAELRADGGDFQTTSDRLAATDGELSPEALLADLRSPALAAFEQPGGLWLGSLSHVVVHGLDVTLPLGLGRVAGDEATRLVLEGMIAGGSTTPFGVDLGTLVTAASGRSTYPG